MASYKVLKKSFIGNAIVEEGAIVEYDGEASDNLEALEAPAPKTGKGKKSDSDALA